MNIEGSPNVIFLSHFFDLHLIILQKLPFMFSKCQPPAMFYSQTKSSLTIQ